MNTHQKAAFTAVLKTLKKNRIMVDTREDGVYIRFAGKPEEGYVFSLNWLKVVDFGGRSNTSLFAQRELEVLSKSATDPGNRPIIEPFIPEILSLVEKFVLSGQSGGSAPYTATALSQAIKKLCLQEPICPITGIDEEWINVAEYNQGQPLYQNSRCGGLFKDGDGHSYYLDAIIWKNERGHCHSGSALLSHGTAFIKYLSRQKVKSFPFTPKTFYVDVTSVEVAPDDWEFYIKNEKQLEKVFHYYDRYLA